jgi:extradiol dioxygenase family protein
MTTAIKIEKVNYFGSDVTGSYEWNAKVLYTRNGKLYHAMIDIDYFGNEVYINTKIQAKECKVYSGLLVELRKMNLTNKR